MPPGPVPFLLKPISTIRAPFAPNPLLLNPDFPPENLFSQAHLLWQSHTLCQREADDEEQDRTKTENGDPTGGTFHVPLKDACNKPRFGRDTRNPLRFLLKPVHNQNPLSIQIHALCQIRQVHPNLEEEKGGISRPSKGPQ